MDIPALLTAYQSEKAEQARHLRAVEAVALEHWNALGRPTSPSLTECLALVHEVSDFSDRHAMTLALAEYERFLEALRQSL